MEHAEYALDVASHLLEYYNKFFEITYPLKKLGECTQAGIIESSSDYFLPCNLASLTLAFFSDLVAIPDFLAGAMENWGLITFRETSLLVGKQSSLLEKQVVASVITHEMAHQVCLYLCLSKH